MALAEGLPLTWAPAGFSILTLGGLVVAAEGAPVAVIQLNHLQAPRTRLVAAQAAHPVKAASRHLHPLFQLDQQVEVVVVAAVPSTVVPQAQAAPDSRAS
jgi:hypothetical protein